ncbi:MAG: PAS domain S-box protein [Candidatus Doudnabacteria bacterium]|nr:PAS domain S-box protein [Candidatus Doudnabacteria bacterium]
MQFTSTTIHDHVDYELRCRNCSKLLGKHALETATIEIKCTRCGTINSILDGKDTLIYITSAEGNIIYANEQLEAITGYTLVDVLGKTPAIWGKQMPEEFYQSFWKTILVQKKATVVHLTNKRKDGTLYECTSRVSPILDERGEVQYFLGIQTIIN